MATLNRFEARRFSQNGEDGIIRALVGYLAPRRFFVEFGVEGGDECNTRVLKHEGWNGVAWDMGAPNPDRNIYAEFITAENINDLFAKYDVPLDLGLLSIDIDGNDFHVWRALSSRYRPSIVVIEYNASLPPASALYIPYRANFQWDGSAYFGASFMALCTLGRSKGYRLVCADSQGVNLFFVREDLVARLPDAIRQESETPLSLYYPPRYGPEGRGHSRDPHHRVFLSL